MLVPPGRLPLSKTRAAADSDGPRGAAAYLPPCRLEAAHVDIPSDKEFEGKGPELAKKGRCRAQS